MSGRESDRSFDDASSSDDGPEIERLARERRVARGLKLAARRALTLARRYRDEEGPRGQREAACVAQALAWRAAAHDVHDTPLAELGPGLARATSSQSNAARRAG